MSAAAWDDGDFRARLETTLADFLDAQSAVLAPLGPDAARLLDGARAAVRGGKRLRAAFCWWGYRALRPHPSPEEERAVLRACAALELLHASALAHDDVMDASDTRRGRPSAHRALEAEHRSAGWRGDAAQYGVAGAILLGDLMLGWAEELLGACGLPPAQVLAGHRVFALCRTEVIAGQFLDVSVQARAHADVDAAMTVLRYKSAKYSIERPLQVGAALAGGDADRLEALSRVGLPLGEAFQLRDDLLGVFGDPAVTGKPAGDDLVEGKRTVLVALALDAADPAAARELDAALGTPLTPDGVARLRAVIERSGAREQVEQVIDALVERALAALEDAPVDDGARAVLRQLADAATRRTL
ncbi:polyprenyl synthetase family protein [Nocardioides nanhaiensis]|uniref:Polyprenyl synthetase family protein n=1 Tax=Nocardioides nanhaiensis TaxID=1476871 RepID=A0ABP8WTD0_9ACTN